MKPVRLRREPDGSQCCLIMSTYRLNFLSHRSYVRRVGTAAVSDLVVLVLVWAVLIHRRA